MLYLSAFFEKNRSLYYDKLTITREKNELNQWIKFFLVGIIETAEEGTKTLEKIMQIKAKAEKKILSFGRRAVLNLRQTLASKILELHKENIYEQYKDKIGQVVYGEVYQIWSKEILLVDANGNEMLLPKSEQIPTDFYRKGDTVKAVVIRVDNKNNKLNTQKT